MAMGKAERKVFDAIGSAAAAAFCFLVVNGNFLGLSPAARTWVLVAVLPVLAVKFVVNLRNHRRESRELREARKAGRWPLGRGYRVGLGQPDSWFDAVQRLEIDETALELGVFRPRRIALAEVDVIHVRPSRIEIEHRGGRLCLVPSAYADRERLLYELAFRCPDAIDRGLDARPPEKDAPANPAPVESAAEFDVRPAPSGLASALAGPMRPHNPSPPRKSGLGVGLFPGTGAPE